MLPRVWIQSVFLLIKLYGELHIYGRLCVLVLLLEQDKDVKYRGGKYTFPFNRPLSNFYLKVKTFFFLEAIL